MLREISFKCRIKIKTSCLVSYIRYLLYTSTILLRMGLSNSLPLLTSNLLHISLTHICSLPFCLTTFWYSFTQALRTRARKQRAARKHNISDLTAGGSIIENIAQTRRLAETTMDGSSKSSKIIPEEEPTRSGSNDEDEENAGWVSLCFFCFVFTFHYHSSTLTGPSLNQILIRGDIPLVDICVSSCIIFQLNGTVGWANKLNGHHRHCCENKSLTIERHVSIHTTTRWLLEDNENYFAIDFSPLLHYGCVLAFMQTWMMEAWSVCEDWWNNYCRRWLVTNKHAHTNIISIVVNFIAHIKYRILHTRHRYQRSVRLSTRECRESSTSLNYWKIKFCSTCQSTQAWNFFPPLLMLIDHQMRGTRTVMS